jgi:hypothetical protein
LSRIIVLASYGLNRLAMSMIGRENVRLIGAIDYGAIDQSTPTNFAEHSLVTVKHGELDPGVLVNHGDFSGRAGPKWHGDRSPLCNLLHADSPLPAQVARRHSRTTPNAGGSHPSWKGS